MKKYRQIHEFLIEENELDIIEDLFPEYYIDENINKKNINAGYAVRFLQNELNSLLNSFVNGGFAYIGFVLYPFIKDVSKENIVRIRRLKDAAIFLNNNGYDFSDSIKAYKNRINSKSFASILSSLYKDFSKIKNKNTTSIRKFKCKELDLNDYRKTDSEYLYPLNELKDYANNNLRQFLCGFYLHGSLATKDYIRGWSDVDTLSIISKRTINDPNALLELRDRFYRMRYFFYRIDALQHHGGIIISEYDLENYCQSYFPISVFRYAKSLFGDDRITKFKARDFSGEALKKMFWFVNYFRGLYMNGKYNLGSYDTKTMLNSITLFPTVYLQSKGTLVYKKFSFGIAKKDFRREDWEVIDDVSSIRANWQDFGRIPLINLASKINPLIYYQLNSRAIDLFKDINKINKIDAEKIIKNMFRLSENAWSRIKKNAESKKI